MPSFSGISPRSTAELCALGITWSSQNNPVNSLSASNNFLYISPVFYVIQRIKKLIHSIDQLSAIVGYPVWLFFIWSANQLFSLVQKDEYMSKNENWSGFVPQTEPTSNFFWCYQWVLPSFQRQGLIYFWPFLPTAEEKGLKHRREGILLWAYILSPVLLFVPLLDSLDQESLDLLVLKVITPSFKHIQSLITSPSEKYVELLLHVYLWSSLQIHLRALLH